MTEKERYATIGTWEKVFREEGYSKSESTLRNRLNEAGVIGEKGRTKGGRYLKEGFYPESDVRRICSDLLEDIPKVNEHGYIERDGYRYYTVYSLSRLFKVSESFIIAIFKDDDLGIRGRDENNVPRTFYPVSQVYEKMKDRKDHPWADEEGFVQVGNERLASLRTWCSHFSVKMDARTIKNWLDELGIRGSSAIDQTKVLRLGTFYAESDFQRAIERHEEPVQLDESGCKLIGGSKYLTVKAYCEMTGLKEVTVRRKLKKLGVKGLEAKNSFGHFVSLYQETHLRSCFSHLLQDCSRADEEGFAYVEGERYATLNKWCSVLEVRIDPRTARRQLVKLGIHGIDAYLASGQLLKKGFYKESDVLRIASTPMESALRADENGFVESDGERYGSISALANLFGVSWKKLKRIIRNNTVDSVQGRPRYGRIFQFYSESAVRALINKSKK